MPLYTRSDLIDAINNNYDSTAIDNIIANLDELATYESGYTTDSSSEIVTVDATDTQYFRLLVDMDDSTSVIICDNIDELNFRTYKGVCQIGSEQIYFGSVNDAYDTTSIMLYDCVRGYNSTTPAEHLTDATGEILYYIADIEYQVWYENITPADETAVLNWKILYYEDVYNQSIRSQGGNVYTDSDSPHYPLRDFSFLYDNNLTSDGVTYDATTWIQCEFADMRLQDRIAVYGDSTGTVKYYVSYSNNGTDWVYLKAQADHTLLNDRLIIANGQSDAITNYWTPTEDTSGKAFAVYPVGTLAKYVRLYILSQTTINECLFLFKTVDDKLETVSKNVGTLTAGQIQSSNFADGGVILDLDNDVMKVYDALGNLRVEIGKLS